MHLIFILIFIFIVLSVLGKIAKAAKTVNTTAKKARRGTFNPLDGLGKVFNASARNEAWMKAAGDLGLSFIRPSTMYDNPSIAGRINGFEIYVTTERDPDQTVYRITFPKSIDIGFLAMRDKVLTMLNRQFSGRKRLEKILNLLPDNLINSAVSAYEEKSLTRFLTQERRDALLKCLKLYDTVKIDDNSITVTYDGIEQNPERLCARINTALMFARAFGCDVEPAGVSSTIPPESRKMPPASPNDIKVMPQPEPLSRNAPLREEQPVKKKETEPVIAETAPQAQPVSDNNLLRKEVLIPALFGSTFVGAKEKELFEKVKGREVVWSGTVKSEYEFGMDFVFGSQGGVKTTLELMDIQQGTYSMKVKIKAVVCFPKEDLQKLRALNGKEITFSGALLKFEGFAKEVYLTSGKLV